jgi:hypothetical protein
VPKSRTENRAATCFSTKETIPHSTPPADFGSKIHGQARGRHGCDSSHERGPVLIRFP